MRVAVLLLSILFVNIGFTQFKAQLSVLKEMRKKNRLPQNEEFLCPLDVWVKEGKKEKR